MIETQDLLLENKTLQEKLVRSESEITYLKFQLEELRRVVFGAKSERFVSHEIPGQLSFEIEKECPKQAEQETVFVDAHDRKKKKKKENHPVRQCFPAHIHREETKIYPEGYDENSLEKPIGEEVTEILEEIPGKFFVKRIIRYKFANKETDGVVIGQLPSRPIEKGLFGELLLTRILIDKYCDHLPMYRQQQRFHRAGIKLAYSTLVDVPRQVCKLFVPLYQELKRQALSGNYLQADETPHPVLSKEKTHQGYLWVYRSVPERLVLFDYRPGRGSEGPKEILKTFKGFIQSDGYAVYDYFDRHPDITVTGCMAHARRYFEKALDNDGKRAEYFMRHVQQLYEVERIIRDEIKTGKEIIELRTQKSLPVLNHLQQWLEENINQVTPASPIGKAITYALARWKKLIAYTAEPFLQIDNNLVENAIRPTVIGRKNYLFSGSDDGAKRTAMIYSFTGSCKMNGINPEKWLADVLVKIPDTKASQLFKLLPNYWKENQ